MQWERSREDLYWYLLPWCMLRFALTLLLALQGEGNESVFWVIAFSFADLILCMFSCCLEGMLFLMVFELEKPCSVFATKVCTSV